MNDPFWTAIAEQITLATGEKFTPQQAHAVGGGCINRGYCLQGQQRRLFVKTNQAGLYSMFEAEAAGLRELASVSAVRVPLPVCHGVHVEKAYLVLEYLAKGRVSSTTQEKLGRRLAKQHRHQADEFGWSRDNTIGSTPQINQQVADWVGFYREQRLGYQFQLAAKNGYGGRLQSSGDKLMANLGVFFSDYAPPPSLLHGDLWSGNYSADEQGEPVIFDPAVYYGDREADLAMTELFGGFGRHFYHAYNEAWPLDAGYSVRKTLYNLYHILNHLNLFGAGYLAQAEAMTLKLLSET